MQSVQKDTKKMGINLPEESRRKCNAQESSQSHMEAVMMFYTVSNKSMSLNPLTVGFFSSTDLKNHNNSRLQKSP